MSSLEHLSQNSRGGVVALRQLLGMVEAHFGELYAVAVRPSCRSMPRQGENGNYIMPINFSKPISKFSISNSDFFVPKSEFSI